MKDLFVYVADADAQAFLKNLLCRHQALGIRPIDFTVDRLTGRDAGMVLEGPELLRARMLKKDYQYAMLLWDHHGSGRESQPSQATVQSMQARLDQVTWQGRSTAIAIVPELEEWLWQCPAALAKLINQPVSMIGSKRSTEPKEAFHTLTLTHLRRRPRISDFEELGRLVSIRDFVRNSSAKSLLNALHSWFPI